MSPAALGPSALRVERIGSTSAPSEAATAVLVPVQDVEDQAAFVPLLQPEGFVLRGREPGAGRIRPAEVALPAL